MSPPLINWECCGFLSWFYMKQIASKFAPSLDQRIVLWPNSVKIEIVKKFFFLTYNAILDMFGLYQSFSINLYMR